MGLSHKIFQRAKIRGIADYLLYGNGPEEDSRTYEERSSSLLDLANAMTCEVASVYMEIGLQTGILLMKDLIQNLDMDAHNKPLDYKKKYDLLLQKVMAALDVLPVSEDENINEVRKILRSTD